MATFPAYLTRLLPHLPGLLMQQAGAAGPLHGAFNAPPSCFASLLRQQAGIAPGGICPGRMVPGAVHLSATPIAGTNPAAGQLPFHSMAGQPAAVLGAATAPLPAAMAGTAPAAEQVQDEPDSPDAPARTVTLPVDGTDAALQAACLALVQDSSRTTVAAASGTLDSPGGAAEVDRCQDRAAVPRSAGMASVPAAAAEVHVPGLPMQAGRLASEAVATDTAAAATGATSHADAREKASAAGPTPDGSATLAGQAAVGTGQVKPQAAVPPPVSQPVAQPPLAGNPGTTAQGLPESSPPPSTAAASPFPAGVTVHSATDTPHPPAAVPGVGPEAIPGAPADSEPVAVRQGKTRTSVPADPSPLDRPPPGTTARQGMAAPIPSQPIHTGEPARLAEARPTSWLETEAAGQVHRQVVEMARLGPSSVRLSLVPEELGRIDIRLAHTSSGLEVSLAADHASTARALESQLGQLRQSLAEAGLSLTSLDISQGSLSGQMQGRGHLAGSFPQGAHPHTPFHPHTPQEAPIARSTHHPLSYNGSTHIDFFI